MQKLFFVSVLTIWFDLATLNSENLSLGPLHNHTKQKLTVLNRLIIYYNNQSIK